MTSKKSFRTYLGSNCLILMYLVSSQTHLRLNWHDFLSKSSFKTYLGSNDLILIYLVSL